MNLPSVRVVRLTLDTNCLINLENHAGPWAEVSELVNAHGEGAVLVFVCAMSASEGQQSGGRLSNFSEFEGWIEKIGCAKLGHILPMGYYGVSFWGHARYASEEGRRLEMLIHDALHPEIEFRYDEFCAAHSLDPGAVPIRRRWLNAKCDVQALWSHINAGNHIFVTEDRRFLTAKRRAALVGLGAGELLTPHAALEALRLRNRVGSASKAPPGSLPGGGS